MLYVFETMEGMRRVLLYTLDVVECEFGLAEVLEMMRCVLLCLPEVMHYVSLRTLETVESGHCLLEVLKVMCRTLLYTPESMEGGLYLLEVLEVVRCVLLCMLSKVGSGY